MENKATGYVAIFRSLQDHWIWQDPQKFQWWIDILLTVNHTPRTWSIGNKVFDVGRGQSVLSLETWAKRWRTSKRTVHSFFQLLRKENMILIENLTVTTRITVCNYDSYNTNGNGSGNARETRGKRMLPPNNNDNNDNNVKKLVSTRTLEERISDFKNELMPHVEIFGRDMMRSFFDYWTEPTADKSKMRKEMEKTWNTEGRLRTWYKREQKQFAK